MARATPIGDQDDQDDQEYVFSSRPSFRHGAEKPGTRSRPLRHDNDQYRGDDRQRHFRVARSGDHDRRSRRGACVVARGGGGVAGEPREGGDGDGHARSRGDVPVVRLVRGRDQDSQRRRVGRQTSRRNDSRCPIRGGARPGNAVERRRSPDRRRRHLRGKNRTTGPGSRRSGDCRGTRVSRRRTRGPQPRRDTTSSTTSCSALCPTRSPHGSTVRCYSSTPGASAGPPSSGTCSTGSCSSPGLPPGRRIRPRS